jgi:redox-sensitive bicupin YhaK (pirin superfamily)
LRNSKTFLECPILFGREPLMSSSVFSEIVIPDTLRVGNGFQAAQLRNNRFDGLIDPIILIDYFALSATQEPYPYAGLSALTYLFEDSSPARYVEGGESQTCGLIGAGDLYWLLAGMGTLHGEYPQGDGVVRGLRVFVDLPTAHKLDAPAGYHVPSAAMPVIQREGLHVRVIAGQSKNVSASAVLPQPFTMLDCRMGAQVRFAHPMPADWNAVVYLIGGGPLIVSALGKTRRLDAGRALAVGTHGGATSLVLSSEAIDAHVVVVALPATAEALALMNEGSGKEGCGKEGCGEEGDGGVAFDEDPTWLTNRVTVVR